jgi:hypothetical protein
LPGGLIIHNKFFFSIDYLGICLNMVSTKIQRILHQSFMRKIRQYGRITRVLNRSGRKGLRGLATRVCQLVRKNGWNADSFRYIIYSMPFLSLGWGGGGWGGMQKSCSAKTPCQNLTGSQRGRIMKVKAVHNDDHLVCRITAVTRCAE